MNEKLTEMIAIGASVTANCIPCIRFHLARARAVGVSDTEIKAAVRIGRMVRKGAAQKWDEEADAMLSSLAEERNAGCGCG